MRRLSFRLQKIADYIEPGESIADIGTDHGKLPIYLSLRRITSKTILSDINAGPLDKARLNIEAYASAYVFDIRQGDGLETIDAYEVDTIIIAGMGGLLIAGILSKDPVKTRSFRKYLLQPRNAADKLRSWLWENDYIIVDESLVSEKKKICEIIYAIPSTNESVERVPTIIEDMPFEISPILFTKKDPLLKEFIHRKITIEKRNLDRITHGKRQIGQKIEDNLHLEVRRIRIKHLESLIDRIVE